MRSSSLRPARSQRTSRTALGIGVAVAIASAAVASPALALAATNNPVTAAVTAATPAAATQQSTFDLADAAASASTAGKAALEAASKLDDAVATSGLDMGSADTSVDTSKLDKAMKEMAVLKAMGSSLLSDVTARVADATPAVVADTSKLEKTYDAAVKADEQRKAEEAAAKKAAEEAAAKKAAEEAAAKKAAEEAAAKKAADEAAAQKAADEAEAAAPAEAASAPPAGAATPAVSGGTDPDSARATARSMLGSFGWGDDQWGCLDSLWMKESGWNYQAYNPSGATGIPQALPGDKMSSAGADWQTNPATQISWGLGYIQGVYGSPCAAWGHSQSVNWY